MKNNPKDIHIEDYDYDLPNEKIAFYPLEQRNQSKLLIFDGEHINDHNFVDLPDLLPQNSFLVFNHSKVIHARLQVKNETGANIEIFCLEPLLPISERAVAFEQQGKVVWKCYVGNAKKWKNSISFTVVINQQKINIITRKLALIGDAFAVSFEWKEKVSFAEWVEHYGKIPLPPYIKRTAEIEDNQRYQTIFAEKKGSVAAPTAGLHFTETELNTLKKRGIEFDYLCLHVGAGTFKPVSADIIGKHSMHQEQIVLEKSFLLNLLAAVQTSKFIVAVGTTVARSLESLFLMGAKLKLSYYQPFIVEQWDWLDNPTLMQISVQDAIIELLNYLDNNNSNRILGYTHLMITPNYSRKLFRALLTNFHQPKSTLLLLITSIVGEKWRDIYQHALENDYRFLSYGDVNLYY
jgi:S-adenosylmethionine:tRNA ribosyltransferase-isomerase